MDDLKDEIRKAQTKAGENVVLMDLRRKGLVDDNQVLVPFDGKALAAARDAWFASDEGEQCMQPELLYNPVEGQRYLKNRLERAFLAGANAAIKVLRKD